MSGWVLIGLVVLAFSLSGCRGGDEAKTVRSMVAVQPGSGDGVAGPNRAPVVEQVLIRPNRPAPGSPVRARARVVDPDGDPTQVEYEWQTASGRVLGKGQAFDTSGLEAGRHLQVVVTATDGQTKSMPVVHEFELAKPAVSISLVAIDTSEGTRPGSPLVAVVEIADDVSDRLEPRLEWKVNGEVVGTGEKLDTARFSPGDIVILRAHLELAGRRTRPVSSSPVVLTRGEAPEILSKPVAGIEGGLFRYRIRARSPEPDAELTYALVRGPEGMDVDPKTGLVEWRPGSDQRGRFEVEVSATDQWGTGIAQSFTIVADAPASSPARPR
ncbi:MAG TPA: hypothetical protein ENI85_18565 [Deltaproteobacteria bacterium]|nr:hypothetical protein [Deltaproteobacteria bacterium]